MYIAKTSHTLFGYVVWPCIEFVSYVGLVVLAGNRALSPSVNFTNKFAANWAFFICFFLSNMWHFETLCTSLHFAISSKWNCQLLTYWLATNHLVIPGWPRTISWSRASHKPSRDRGISSGHATNAVISQQQNGCFAVSYRRNILYHHHQWQQQQRQQCTHCSDATVKDAASQTVSGEKKLTKRFVVNKAKYVKASLKNLDGRCSIKTPRWSAENQNQNICTSWQEQTACYGIVKVLIKYQQTVDC